MSDKAAGGLWELEFRGYDRNSHSFNEDKSLVDFFHY